MPDSLKEALLKVVAESELRTHADAIAVLRERGISLTQSTVSRMLRELQVSKVDGVYVLKTQRSRVGGDKNVSSLGEWILDVGIAGPNLTVVKTRSGSAGALAEIFDRAQVAGVVGTVAGDNTIFVATSDRVAQKAVTSFFRDLGG